MDLDNSTNKSKNINFNETQTTIDLKNINTEQMTSLEFQNSKIESFKKSPKRSDKRSKLAFDSSENHSPVVTILKPKIP